MARLKCAIGAAASRRSAALVVSQFEKVNFHA
jgi:hypothetical protein